MSTKPKIPSRSVAQPDCTGPCNRQLVRNEYGSGPLNAMAKWVVMETPITKAMVIGIRDAYQQAVKM